MSSEWLSTTVGPGLFTCVEYPGVVDSRVDILASMGGSGGVAAAVQEHRRGIPPKKTGPAPGLRLDLSLGEQLSNNAHLLTGTGQTVTGVLLRVRRRRRDGRLTVEGLGMTDVTWSFDAPADYQFLCPTTACLTTEGSDVLDEDFFDTDTTLRTIPDVFTGPPFDYNFRQNLFFGEQRPPATNDLSIIISFADATPAVHPNFTDPEVGLSDTEVEQLRALRALFNERPVWSRNTMEHLHPEVHFSRRLLTRIAYSFNGGPFRSLHVLFGVDPRSSPEFRAFQLFDIRLASKAAATDRQLVDKTPAILTFETLENTSAVQMALQMCDIHEPAVRAILDSQPPTAECHPLRGWMADGVLDEARRFIKQQMDLTVVRPRFRSAPPTFTRGSKAGTSKPNAPKTKAKAKGAAAAAAASATATTGVQAATSLPELDENLFSDIFGDDFSFD